MAKKKTAKKSATKKSAKKSAGSKTSGKKSSAKKSTTKKKRRKASRRELIDTGTDKRYVRRDDSGRFNESDDVGRSLSMDRRRKAKTKAKPGMGDRGD